MVNEWKDMKYLLNYAKGKEEQYNKIANFIFKNFGASSAEVTLFILYCMNELKDDEKNE